jgi:hypothetical protein
VGMGRCICRVRVSSLPLSTNRRNIYLLGQEYILVVIRLNGQLINLEASGSSIHIFASLNGFSGNQLGYLKLSSDGTPSSTSITSLDNISSKNDLAITINENHHSVTASYVSSGIVKTISFSVDGGLTKPTPIKRDKKNSGSGKIPVALKELGLGRKGYFLVVYEDDSADIVETKGGGGGGGEVIWHFDNEVRNVCVVGLLFQVFFWGG